MMWSGAIRRVMVMVLAAFAFLFAAPAAAQSPVTVYGKDANGVQRVLRTDTSGQVIMSSTQTQVSASVWSQTQTIPANNTTCSTAGGASCTIVFPETNLLSWTNITISIKNTGSNALTDCLIEWSPPNVANTASKGYYEVWNSTTFASLSAGSVLSLSFAGNSRAYLRIEGRSTSGTTLDITVTANGG